MDSGPSSNKYVLLLFSELSGFTKGPLSFHGLPTKLLGLQRARSAPHPINCCSVMCTGPPAGQDLQRASKPHRRCPFLPSFLPPGSHTLQHVLPPPPLCKPLEMGQALEA